MIRHYLRNFDKIKKKDNKATTLIKCSDIKELTFDHLELMTAIKQFTMFLNDHKIYSEKSSNC